MVVGRMYEDLEKFAETTHASVTIDVLRRVAIKDGSEPLSLRIIDELAAWLTHRMSVSNIPSEAVSAATLHVDLRSDRVATERKRIVLFDLECRCEIDT